jgi:thiol-disulfide isomerase/thioredoxin
MLKSLTRKFNKILPKGNKITPTTFVILILIVISIIITFRLLKMVYIELRDFFTHMLLPKRESFEGQKELLLLHMEGCPHCVTLMPHWKAAASENTTSIKMRALERKDDGAAEIIKANKVTGFPTILLMGGGKKLDTYSGKRDKSGLLSYCKKNE